MVDLGKGGHQGRLEYQWISPGEAAQKMSLVAATSLGLDPGLRPLLQDMRPPSGPSTPKMGERHPAARSC